MAHPIAADASDRLPWLPNSTPERRSARPQPRQAARSWFPLILAISAAAAIAFGGWALVQPDTAAPTNQDAVEPAGTVALPPPSAAPDAAAEPQLPSASERDALRPQAPMSAQATSERSAKPARSHVASGSAAERRDRTAAARRADNPTAAAASRAAVAARSQPLTLWPARQVRGAGGRLVQIGAFGSRQQAKLGWRRMQRAYPAVGRLPAVVVQARNSTGRKYYRFQIGTTSHAHSEVLCQRMQMIGFSCAVLGLPWKAKVER